MPGKLIICRGLPASGRTTWAQNYVRAELDKGNTRVQIVERDALRKMAGLGVEPTKYESTITAQEQALLRAALKTGDTVISTNLNLRAQYVKGMATLAQKFGAGVEVKDFDVPIAVCIARDLQRGLNGGHTVGADFIRKLHKQFFNNGFPKSPIGKIEPYELLPYVRDIKLPRAKIFDVDGTLADHLGKRSPYDYTKVHLDEPHLDVLQELVHSWELGYKNIILSGREDSCWAATVEWLRVHTGLPIAEPNDPNNIPLFMRQAGDDRADFIVKHELFHNEIAPYYNVVGIYDDRAQVIQMWREIGLRCYDVAGHTF